MDNRIACLLRYHQCLFKNLSWSTFPRGYRRWMDSRNLRCCNNLYCLQVNHKRRRYNPAKMNTWLTVFIGGGLGSILRYGIGVIFHQIVPARFPFATLISNCLSSIILGLFLGIVLVKNVNDPALRYFIIVGFCGGLS